MSNILDKLTIGLRPYLLFVCLIFAFSLPPALSLAPLDRDEARFMQATTQMFETKDFVQIRFQDTARNKKPIGIHWLQAASLQLSGNPLSRDPFPFRIISVLGALLCVISTFKIGETLFDRRIGLVAGLMMATSLLLTTEAHIAKTDASLAGFIALSFYGLAKIRFDAPSLANILLFWIAFAMAVLIKGPVPIMVIGLALIAMAITDRGISWLKPLLNWRGIALFFAIILPWFIAIGVVTDWQFYKDAIGQDLAPKLNGTSENKPIPPGAHLLLAPIIFWPGSILLGVAVWAGVTLSKQAKVRFLLAFIIPTWLVFELSPAKLVHYTLPCHAGVAVLASYGLYSGGFKSKFAKISGVIFYSLGLAVLCALPIYLAKEHAPLMLQYAINIAIIIGGFGLVGLAFAIKDSWLAAPFMALSGLAFAFLVKAQLLPNIAALNVSTQISSALEARGLHPRLSPNIGKQAIIGAGYQEPSLIFLTESFSHLESIETALKYANIGAPVVIEDGYLAQFLDKLPDNLKFNEIGAPIIGLNYSKGDEVIIRIGQIQRGQIQIGQIQKRNKLKGEE